MFKKTKLDLFWFLKKDAQLDLDDPRTRQIYVQQVLTRGHEADIRELLKDIGVDGVDQVFNDIKRYIPCEVRMFWEDFFADHHSFSK